MIDFAIGLGVFVGVSVVALLVLTIVAEIKGWKLL